MGLFSGIGKKVKKAFGGDGGDILKLAALAGLTYLTAGAAAPATAAAAAPTTGAAAGGTGSAAAGAGATVAGETAATQAAANAAAQAAAPTVTATGAAANAAPIVEAGIKTSAMSAPVGAGSAAAPIANVAGGGGASASLATGAGWEQIKLGMQIASAANTLVGGQAPSAPAAQPTANPSQWYNSQAGVAPRQNVAAGSGAPTTMNNTLGTSPQGVTATPRLGSRRLLG